MSEAKSISWLEAIKDTSDPNNVVDKFVTDFNRRPPISVAYEFFDEVFVKFVIPNEIQLKSFERAFCAGQIKVVFDRVQDFDHKRLTDTSKISDKIYCDKLAIFFRRLIEKNGRELLNFKPFAIGVFKLAFNLSDSVISDYRYICTMFCLNMVTGLFASSSPNNNNNNNNNVVTFDRFNVVIEAVLNDVFKKRLADTVYRIRQLCIHELVMWMKLRPEQFATFAYFEYLANALNDRAIEVRSYACDTIKGLLLHANEDRRFIILAKIMLPLLPEMITQQQQHQQHDQNDKLLKTILEIFNAISWYFYDDETAAEIDRVKYEIFGLMFFNNKKNDKYSELANSMLRNDLDKIIDNPKKQLLLIIRFLLNGSSSSTLTNSIIELFVKINFTQFKVLSNYRTIVEMILDPSIGKNESITLTNILTCIANRIISSNRTSHSTNTRTSNKTVSEYRSIVLSNLENLMNCGDKFITGGDDETVYYYYSEIVRILLVLGVSSCLVNGPYQLVLNKTVRLMLDPTGCCDNFNHLVCSLLLSAAAVAASNDDSAADNNDNEEWLVLSFKLYAGDKLDELRNELYLKFTYYIRCLLRHPEYFVMAECRNDFMRCLFKSVSVCKRWPNLSELFTDYLLTNVPFDYLFNYYETSEPKFSGQLITHLSLLYRTRLENRLSDERSTNNKVVEFILHVCRYMLKNPYESLSLYTSVYTLYVKCDDENRDLKDVIFPIDILNTFPEFVIAYLSKPPSYTTTTTTNTTTTTVVEKTNLVNDLLQLMLHHGMPYICIRQLLFNYLPNLDCFNRPFSIYFEQLFARDPTGFSDILYTVLLSSFKCVHLKVTAIGDDSNTNTTNNNNNNNNDDVCKQLQMFEDVCQLSFRMCEILWKRKDVHQIHVCNLHKRAIDWSLQADDNGHHCRTQFLFVLAHFIFILTQHSRRSLIDIINGRINEQLKLNNSVCTYVEALTSAAVVKMPAWPLNYKRLWPRKIGEEN